jgi:hypothetical protein
MVFFGGEGEGGSEGGAGETTGVLIGDGCGGEWLLLLLRDLEEMGAVNVNGLR